MKKPRTIGAMSPGILAVEVAKRLGCGRRQVDDYQRDGVLAPPRYSAGGYKYWSEEEVLAAEALLAARRARRKKILDEGRKRVSKAGIAEEREVEHVACRLWKKRGLDALVHELRAIGAPSPAEVRPEARRLFIHNAEKRIELGW